MASPDVAIERSGDVSDEELERLLHLVYVDGGYTEADQARSLFAAAAVRARGTLVTARAPAALVGVVLVVAADSPARRLAQTDEAEMHLLAVAPEARGRGVGRLLVDEAVHITRERGLARMVLWTQATMHTAQRLYLDAGFTRAPQRDFERSARSFLVFTLDTRPA